MLSFPLPPAPFGQCVHSPAFKFSGHEFRLKVFPHGNQAAVGKWISAYLEWTITQRPPPTARFALSMEAANGTAMVSKIATHSFSPAKPLWDSASSRVGGSFAAAAAWQCACTAHDPGCQPGR